MKGWLFPKQDIHPYQSTHITRAQYKQQDIGSGKVEGLLSCMIMFLILHCTNLQVDTYFMLEFRTRFSMLDPVAWSYDYFNFLLRYCKVKYNFGKYHDISASYICSQLENPSEYLTKKVHLSWKRSLLKVDYCILASNYPL